MGEYALLSEVYGSDFKKEKKGKKSKKKIPVIEPDEMDKVLLGEQTVSPEVKIRNMNIDPYEGSEAKLLDIIQFSNDGEPEPVIKAIPPPSICTLLFLMIEFFIIDSELLFINNIPPPLEL